MLYTQCTRTHAACGQYAYDLTTRAHLDTFVQFRVVSLCVVDMPNIFRKASKPSQERTGYGTGDNERGLDVWQKTAELGRLTGGG